MKRGCLIMYLHENKDDFWEAIATVAAAKGITSQIVEKDYYVTLLLRLLAENLPFIVFKGGTSLSKCHHVIKRFSEDIDLTIDTKITQGQKAFVKEALQNVTQKLSLQITNIEDIWTRRNYNRYVIHYPSAVSLVDGVTRAEIIVETSYKTISYPTKRMQVSNYLGDYFREYNSALVEDLFLDKFEMKVQQIDRTLADKVFAICDYCLQQRTERNSRHLYDIYKLLPLVALDEKFRSLINDVRKDRLLSPVCLSAKENINPQYILEKIVHEKVYEHDYNSITKKLLNEEVDYQVAITALERIIESNLFVF